MFLAILTKESGYIVRPVSHANWNLIEYSDFRLEWF